MFPGEMNHMFTQKRVHIVSEQHLFILAKKWNPPKSPSADERVNKMQYLHKTECYLAIKRKKILILIMWTNLENIVLSERGHVQRTTYYVIPFIQSVQKLW